MHPMIAGLGPLTGDGILGYFIEKNGGKTSWSYQNGTTDDVSVLDPYAVKNKNSKIFSYLSLSTLKQCKNC